MPEATTDPGPSERTTDEGAALPTGSSGGLLVWVRRVVVVVVVALATVQVVREWSEVSATLADLQVVPVLLSFLAVSVGVLLGPLVWREALAAVGSQVRIPDAAKIYLVGQLGKYVPGSVVAFLLQMELAKSAGITRMNGFIASLVTAGVAVVTSLLAATTAVPALIRNEPSLLWLFLLLPVGLAMLHPTPLTFVVQKLLVLLRQRPLEQRLTGRALARATGSSLLIYVAYGLHLFVLVSSLGSEWPMGAGLGLVLCIGTMGMAMTAGLVAFVLPSGIGARELVVVGALAAVLPYGQALALAIVSRVMFTVVELVFAGVATLVARLSADVRTPAA
ncbi:lysylphosphatidylglycerol synthase domain-containing protein [Blastococcus atacamensis]|uniref:lysylphosphatidylglycerol synthase domain-containing protein n=1 Tax=Blastococcus atacamensis TaxID=2070508 RepID=UPI00130004DA|nr:lysylphosphatidylglycerol synthase domain-containing protein [Blastococcus atacamensis]